MKNSKRDFHFIMFLLCTKYILPAPHIRYLQKYFIFAKTEDQQKLYGSATPSLGLICILCKLYTCYYGPHEQQYGNCAHWHIHCMRGKERQTQIRNEGINRLCLFSIKPTSCVRHFFMVPFFWLLHTLFYPFTWMYSVSFGFFPPLQTVTIYLCHYYYYVGI